MTNGLGSYLDKHLWHWQPQDTSPFQLMVGVAALTIALCAARLAKPYDKKELCLRLLWVVTAFAPLLLALRLADLYLVKSARAQEERHAPHAAPGTPSRAEAVGERRECAASVPTECG